MTSDAADCPFCGRVRDPDAQLATNRHAVAFADAFPVTEGHALVVPREHVGRLSDLDEDAYVDVWLLVREVERHITARLGPDGFTIGANVGEAAGQTVPHAHVHLIPRKHGDHEDPRGGIRWVVPERAAYWERATHRDDDADS
jgi:diadenosine tetraphosphate (Ap4A) HIT family hydrolase